VASFASKLARIVGCSLTVRILIVGGIALVFASTATVMSELVRFARLRRERGVKAYSKLLTLSMMVYLSRCGKILVPRFQLRMIEDKLRDRWRRSFGDDKRASWWWPTFCMELVEQNCQFDQTNAVIVLLKLPPPH